MPSASGARATSSSRTSCHTDGPSAMNAPRSGPPSSARPVSRCASTTVSCSRTPTRGRSPSTEKTPYGRLSRPKRVLTGPAPPARAGRCPARPTRRTRTSAWPARGRGPRPVRSSRAESCSVQRSERVRLTVEEQLGGHQHVHDTEVRPGGDRVAQAATGERQLAVQRCVDPARQGGAVEREEAGSAAGRPRRPRLPRRASRRRRESQAARRAPRCPRRAHPAARASSTAATTRRAFPGRSSRSRRVISIRTRSSPSFVHSPAGPAT